MAFSLGIFIFLGVVSFFGGDNLVSAQNVDQIAWGGEQAQVQNAIKLTAADPRIVIARIIQVFLGFLGIIAVVLIIYAGFVWMTSEGDDAKIQKAKDTLKSAVIGLIIILSAFSIATFIISRLLGGGAYGPGNGGGPDNVPFGNGAMGNCAIVDYYPVADQKDVVRNTVVMVTFREMINFKTVADAMLNIKPKNNVLLFNKCVATCDTGTGTGCDSCLVDATATTTDGRNMVIMPKEYLGSASENTNYFVVLKNDIQKASSTDSIFSGCTPDSANWTFEVGTKLDLDPPYVKLKDKSGVFPLPDTLQDITATTSAAKATGTISVGATGNTLKLLREAAVSSETNNGGGWSNINATVNERCDTSQLKVDLSVGLVPSLTRISDSAPMGSGVIASDNKTIDFSYCGLKITLVSGDYGACDGSPYSNCNWNVIIDPYREPDQLTVGGSVYIFVAAGAGSSRIIVPGVVTPVTIANAIRGKFFPNVDVSGAGANVNVAAKTSDIAGNGINLSSNRSDIFTFTGMSGGRDFGINTTVKGEKDEPRNAIIKINFNDQMLPITISGDAQTLQNKIFVQCLSGNCTDNSYFFDCNSGQRCVRGKFMVSNQYQTVEFQSNNKCGVNGCGEDIYCLPGGSKLRVGLIAASLATCSTAADCAGKSPYNICGTNNHCQKADGTNYPLASTTFDGLMDKARNSLDGNRDANAFGPISFYTDNEASSSPTNFNKGDNFEWSFYVSNQIDMNPPIVEKVLPLMGENKAATSVPVTIDFNKKMMSYSLLPGYRTITMSNNEMVRHKTLNLWAKSGFPIGYWVTSDDETGKTISKINHSYFTDYNSYRSQAGSGVKDVYQNCFKPSSGPGCTASFANPACCVSGATTITATSAVNSEGNCAN